MVQLSNKPMPHNPCATGAMNAAQAKKIGARLCNLAILTKIGAIVYTLHRFECWCVVVVNENTRFHLTSDASIWLRPMGAEHCS